MSGYLERLWDWLDDAIANRFDPATALYQPVGGVLHRTEGAPTVVVSQPLGHAAMASASMTSRSVATGSPCRRRCPKPPRAVRDGVMRGVLVVLSDAVPRGGGHYLSDLAVAIRGQDSRKQRKQFISVVSEDRPFTRQGPPLHVLIAVPNRHLTGEAAPHLIGWRLAQPRSPGSRRHERRHHPDSPHPEDEPPVDGPSSTTAAAVSRPDATRRAPVSWFAGKAVELWGCGALGSLIAERARPRRGQHDHPARHRLRDHRPPRPAELHRARRWPAHRRRPRRPPPSQSPTASSSSSAGIAQTALQGRLDADVIIDCTVNTGVAVAIDQAQISGTLQTPVVQAATDNDSATLGILTVCTESPAKEH